MKQQHDICLEVSKYGCACMKPKGHSGHHDSMCGFPSHSTWPQEEYAFQCKECDGPMEFTPRCAHCGGDPVNAELLEALKECVYQLTMTGEATKFQCIADAIEQGQAAIAKAERRDEVKG